MPKALVRDGDRLWVEQALRTLQNGGCDPVVVVLGAAADQVRDEADLSGATVVVNPDWESGMGSSLRAGLATLSALSVAALPEETSRSVTDWVARPGPAGRRAGTIDAALVLLVDTPGVTAAAVSRLVQYAHPAVLAVATYHGRRGHPVLLGRDHWDGVAELAIGDVGARAYLRTRPVQEVPCEDIAWGGDVDLPSSEPDT